MSSEVSNKICQVQWCEGIEEYLGRSPLPGCVCKATETLRVGNKHCEGSINGFENLASWLCSGKSGFVRGTDDMDEDEPFEEVLCEARLAGPRISLGTGQARSCKFERATGLGFVPGLAPGLAAGWDVVRATYG